MRLAGGGGVRACWRQVLALRWRCPQRYARRGVAGGALHRAEQGALPHRGVGVRGVRLGVCALQPGAWAASETRQAATQLPQLQSPLRRGRALDRDEGGEAARPGLPATAEAWRVVRRGGGQRAEARGAVGARQPARLEGARAVRGAARRSPGGGRMGARRGGGGAADGGGDEGGGSLRRVHAVGLGEVPEGHRRVRGAVGGGEARGLVEPRAVVGAAGRRRRSHPAGTGEGCGNQQDEGGATWRRWTGGRCESGWWS